jgi:hypothetical protein
MVGLVSMSPTDADVLRDVIRTVLARRAGSAPDSVAIAEATVDTWRQVVAQLEPVIGARGVDVLFGRALHQVSATFPWAAGAVDPRTRSVSLTDLKERFAKQEAAAAGEASASLLLCFVTLLATLIGESLTERLLAPVWAPPSSRSKQEPKT